jgi:hypothetical protein
MVPLERVLRKPGSDAVEGFVLPALKPRTRDETDAVGPRRFKVVHVLTRRVLGENLAAGAAINVLEGVDSIVDVTVYVWEPSTERWRRLTFGETKALWEYRGRLRAGAREPEPSPAS